MAWSGLLAALWRARRTPGRILPAAQPQMELTTTMVVPGCLRALSTSSAVRASWMPARGSSSRIGMTISSGYIFLVLLLGVAFGIGFRRGGLGALVSTPSPSILRKVLRV